MKRLLKILFLILEVIVILFAVLMVSIVFMRNDYGYTQFGKDTFILVDDKNTTELTHYKSGDLLIIKNVNYNDIKIGDELYYYDTVGQEYVVRIGTVKTKTGDNRTALYTFKENDQLSIASERVLGTYKTSYSNYGAVIKFLTSTVGFLLCVILPILVLFIYQIYHLIMIIKYDKD